MIVSDPIATIAKADEVALKLLKIINEETQHFTSESNRPDDPAENIYLAVHILGRLCAKTCISLEGFGKIYAIPSLTIEESKKWVDLITKENIGFHQRLIKN